MYFETHHRQVDLVEVEAQLASEDLGSHRLAGAQRAGEEHVQALAQGQLTVEAPGLVDLQYFTASAISAAARAVRREDDVTPGVAGGAPPLAGGSPTAARRTRRPTARGITGSQVVSALSARRESPEDRTPRVYELLLRNAEHLELLVHLLDDSGPGRCRTSRSVRSALQRCQDVLPMER